MLFDVSWGIIYVWSSQNLWHMASRKFAKINHVISYDELKYYDCSLRCHVNCWENIIIKREYFQAILIYFYQN